MEPAQSIQELEIIVGRIKRLEISLEEHTRALGKYHLKISEDSKALTLEVEQIREVGHSIAKTLSDTLEGVVKSMVPELVSLTVKGLEENTRPLVEANLDQITKMTGITTDALSQGRAVISSCKRDLTIRRALLAASFWLGSMATAGLVYYYFPQHIHQGYSDEFLKTYFVGKAVRDHFNNLSPKDQSLIQEKFERIYYLGSKK